MHEIYISLIYYSTILSFMDLNFNSEGSASVLAKKTPYVVRGLFSILLM